MANISAFQANDASSILAARTKRIHPPCVGVFFWFESRRFGLASEFAEQTDASS